MAQANSSDPFLSSPSPGPDGARGAAPVKSVGAPAAIGRYIAEYGTQNRATNHDWVTLTGNVQSRTSNSLILDTGRAQIRVEVDDDQTFPLDAIRPGKKVAVNGMVDHDVFECKKIEANWIYRFSQRSYYYSDAGDEEDSQSNIYETVPYALDGAYVGLTGTVVAVDKADDTLSVISGGQMLTIDVGALGHNPKVAAGNRVSVYAEMDDADLFGGRELLATSVSVLSR
jgi:RNase P/RNase MRP subunit p29